MELPFSINTDVYDADTDPEPRLAVFAEAGFRFIHWCEHVCTDHVYSHQEIARSRGLLDRMGLTCHDVHGVYSVKGTDPLDLSGWVDLTINRMELTRAIGADVIVLHLPIGLADCLPSPVETARRMVDAVLPAAGRLGVHLTIENTAGNAGLIEELFATYAFKELGLCYDSGHAQIDGSLDVLEAFSDRVLVSHLHDNDGTHDDHNRPGDGLIDWERVMRFLSGVPHLRTLGLEVGHRDQEDHLKWLQQAYRMLAEVSSAPRDEG